MATIPTFDTRVMEALAMASSDPDAAAQALMLAAEYLRAGAPMPEALADHLAGAIEASMAKSKGAREKALLQELKLTAPNARTKGDYYLVGQLVEQSMRAGNALGTAVNDAMADPRISIKSPATIKKLYKQYLAARATHDSVH
jgi:hypothetical protein